MAIGFSQHALQRTSRKFTYHKLIFTHLPRTSLNSYHDRTWTKRKHLYRTGTGDWENWHQTSIPGSAALLCIRVAFVQSQFWCQMKVEHRVASGEPLRVNTTTQPWRNWLPGPWRFWAEDREANVGVPKIRFSARGSLEFVDCMKPFGSSLNPLPPENGYLTLSKTLKKSFWRPFTWSKVLQKLVGKYGKGVIPQKG